MISLSQFNPIAVPSFSLACMHVHKTKAQFSSVQLSSTSLRRRLLLGVEVHSGNRQAEIKVCSEEAGVEVGTARRLVHQS